MRRMMGSWVLMVLCSIGSSLQDQDQWAPGYIVNGQGRLIHSYRYDYDDNVPSAQEARLVFRNKDHVESYLQQISSAKKVENSANYVANHRTYQQNSNVPSFQQILASRRRNFYRKSDEDHGQAARTKSIGETYIQQKISQLKNVIAKADETLDAMFTLLVPGHQERKWRNTRRNDSGEESSDISAFTLIVSSLVVAVILSL